MGHRKVTAFWLDRPVLVTGATGLVGAAVVGRLVDARADVVCLIRDRVPKARFNRSHLGDRVTSVHGDVRDRALLEQTLGEYEIATVIHLAAQTIVPVANRNPISTFETNIAGTWSLLEAARRSPCVTQVVIASSDKAYGAADELPYDEETALAGRHPYDVSKSCADLIAQAYATTYDLPVVITRCGNFYGPGDLNWNRIIPGTIRSIFRGQRPVIRSDGSPIRDYFHVDDGAAAYLLLAERLAADPSLAGEAFNFSNEDPVTVADLVGRLCSILGSDLEPDIRNGGGTEIPSQWLSATKARERLGWGPIYGLEDGLRLTVEWYREFFADD